MEMRIHHAVLALGVALVALPPRAVPSDLQAPRPVPAQTASPRAPATSEVVPPAEEGSVRLAIIGDSGTGTRPQFEVGAQMARARQRFPFEFVIMLGDNIYGSERPQDYRQKFERPYEALLSAKVPFYAALGNHDDTTQRFYKLFNMNGERFYTFTKGDVRLFALDSNYMDQAQLKWLETELARSTDRWKVAYFHHPLYSSGGRHGSETDLRAVVEPLFIKYGIDVVFAGHEHFYERIKPQKGIYYFIAGGSAKLARGDIRRTPMTAAGVDTDHTFMLAELGRNSMRFQVLSRAGRRVDDGALPLQPEPEPADKAQSRAR